MSFLYEVPQPRECEFNSAHAVYIQPDNTDPAVSEEEEKGKNTWKTPHSICHQKTNPINVRELNGVLLTQKSDQNRYTGLFLLSGEGRGIPEASFPC